MNYDKLTKKELICTLIARDEMLKNCRERFELHKTTDATTIQDQSDLIDILNKALELACDTAQFEDTCDYCAYKGELEITNDCPRWCETDKKFFATQAMGYFKEQAKEMMKSE